MIENWQQAVVLSIIQGVTEFLPVSSSAHLIIVPQLLEWSDQGLGFDVAVHVGTLLAVLCYFRRDLTAMLVNWPRDRLMWAVLLGTIPVGLMGLLFNDLVAAHCRSGKIISVTTIGFGVLLGWAYIISKQERSELRWRDILFIGCAQALALIPGTSRSGITLTAGMLAGFSQAAAARYAFLLSIPVIILAGGLETVKMFNHPQTINTSLLLGSVMISAISGYACIHLFLSLLSKIGMLPFVLYRITLGLLLSYFYF